MFGYPAAFAASGHMVTGLHGERWIVRLAEPDQALLRDAGGVALEPMPGRPMAGFLSLTNEIVDDDATLAGWISRAEAHASTLPPKKPKKPNKPRSSA